jgi:hypothetical protein
MSAEPQAGTAVPAYYPFGINDIWIYPLDANDAPQTGVHVQAGRTLTIAPTEDTQELTGYNGVVASNVSGTAADVTLEYGGISLTVLAAIAGGTIVETGTAPSLVRTLDVGTQGVARPNVMVVGQSLADNWGDVWIKAWKVKFQLPGGDMAESEYYVSSTDGQAVRNKDGKLLSFIDHQVATALTTAPPT